MDELTVRQAQDWAEVWPAAKPLFAEHHSELEAEAKLGHSPDAELAARLFRASALQVTLALRGTRLIGYCMWYVSPSLETAGELLAQQGPWFVTATERKSSAGLRLFRQSLKHLKTLGLRQVFPHHWAKSPLGLDKFFLGLGARPLETVYSLWIGEN